MTTRKQGEMKKDTTPQALAATRESLLQSLNLLDLMADESAPGYLKSLNKAFVETLLAEAGLPEGFNGLYPELSRLLGLCSQQGGPLAREILQADVEILQKLKKTGEDQVHEGLFGAREAGFPVRLQGSVVHCVWTGKVLSRPLSAADRKKLIEGSGLPKKEAEALADQAPVLDDAQMGRVLEMVRRLRNAIEQALTHHVRATELTRQLVQSERTHSLGTLSGGVAHHFNNLLSIILGYSSLVLNRGKLPSEAEEGLHKISEAAQRGRRLTEEVLAFLGSEAEEDVLCRIHDMLHSALSLLETQISAGVRLETKLEAKRDDIMAPPGAIRQILFNLLSNAADTLSAGGVLSVSTFNSPMKNDEGKAQEFFCLEVSDNSVLAEPVAHRPHEPADLSRKGMKLSSLYGLVGRLEGSVILPTEAGSISRVQVFLPLVSAKKQAQEAVEPAKGRLAPCHIWVVDDDPIFCAMCRQLLLDERHTVEQMTSGRELHERWQKEEKKPDLFIIDFSMPEYNGLQLCEWLKNKGSQAPVILVSGFAPSQPDIRKALKMKKTAFLQKPFTSRELSDSISMAMGETLIGG